MMLIIGNRSEYCNSDIMITAYNTNVYKAPLVVTVNNVSVINNKQYQWSKTYITQEYITLTLLCFSLSLTKQGHNIKIRRTKNANNVKASGSAILIFFSFFKLNKCTVFEIEYKFIIENVQHIIYRCSCFC